MLEEEVDSYSQKEGIQKILCFLDLLAQDQNSKEKKNPELETR